MKNEKKLNKPFDADNYLTLSYQLYYFIANYINKNYAEKFKIY
jgi:hypothetical protein